MSFTSYLLIAVALSAPKVELSTLSGEQHSGQLRGLTAESVTVAQEGGDREIPVTELMDLRFPEAVTGGSTQGAFGVQLLDGSRISCTDFTTSARNASLTGVHVGEVRISLSELSNIRFAPADERLEEDWEKLTQRNLKRDLIVIRKGNVLDYQDGIVGEINEEVVNFLLEGEEIPIKRDKVFGVIYARRPKRPGNNFCRVVMGESDELFVRAVSFDEQGLKATLVTGDRVKLALPAIKVLDFSLGKVLYLSQMEPREVKYTPFFDITWEYRRDRHLDGGPIRVGNKEYERGLSIHSRTLLRYRLGGDYRRFQAVMGIDQVVARQAPGRNGDVHVVITADEKVLLETDVRGSDVPRVLDLEVTGVRDLEILVDFGGDLDIADHLDLADARVVK